MKRVPLFKSASWADVEEENPPSPPRAPMPAPISVPAPKWASDNDPSMAPVRKAEQPPVENSSKSRTGGNRSSSGKLWEPPGAKDNTGKAGGNKSFGSAAPDSAQSWRRAEAPDRPQRQARKPREHATGGEEGKKKDRQGKTNGRQGQKSSDSTPKFELGMEPIPETITETEVRDLFEADKVIRVKLAKGRAYVVFADKEALDRALKVKGPRWGEKDVRLFAAQPKKKATGDSGVAKQKPTSKPKDAKSQGKATTQTATSEKPVRAAKSIEPVIKKKNLNADDGKKTNIFAAAFDSSSDDGSEEDDEDGDEVEDEEQDATDEEEADK